MTRTVSTEGDHGTTVVLGGTGMLWPLSVKLAESGSCVHAVGRRSRPPVPEFSITLCGTDWHDRGSYLAMLQQLASFAPQRVIAWLQSDAAVQHDEACAILMPGVYVEVIGSATARDGHTRLFQPPINSVGTRRQRVVLGEFRDGADRRWLTHDEISLGVFEAIASGQRVCVVGELPD